jgi:hypothetical protein
MMLVFYPSLDPEHEARGFFVPSRRPVLSASLPKNLMQTGVIARLRACVHFVFQSSAEPAVFVQVVNPLSMAAHAAFKEHHRPTISNQLRATPNHLGFRILLGRGGTTGRLQFSLFVRTVRQAVISSAAEHAIDPDWLRETLELQW